MMDNQTIQELAAGFCGRLIYPYDSHYEKARAIHNAMIDKRPRLMARCADVADVTSAVKFGRFEGLEIAVRVGGHNEPGWHW